MRVRPQVPEVEATTGRKVPGEAGNYWRGNTGDHRQAGGSGGRRRTAAQQDQWRWLRRH